MTLINCAICKGHISSYADFCPHCDNKSINILDQSYLQGNTHVDISKIDETGNHIQLDYHYEDNGHRKGPVKRAEIQRLIDSNILDRNSKIWCKNYANWKIITETDFDLSKLLPPPLAGNSINNGYIWLLAFAPLIGTFLEYFVGYTFSSNDYQAELKVENGDYWKITLLVNVLISWLDEKQLHKAGHETSKYKGWLWLIPVYLYIRCRKTEISLAPFVIWLILFILTLY